jgi:hypothetical protein
MATAKLTKKEYLKEAEDLVVLAQHYLVQGDMEKNKSYVHAAIGALRCALKAEN